MPRVKVDYIVSFSSEDPEHPASSLLAEEVSRRRWVTAGAGEVSASVVLQLARSTRIVSVTVGSHDSALVEVLVGRSESPNQPYQVLVLSSVFMTPAESKKGPGVSRVRTFGSEQLASDVRAQCWDRVRVVCRQPYNKHIKYGLSFIHIFDAESAGDDSGASQSSRPASFQLSAASSDEEDSFKPGELFAKMRENISQLSIDSQIRQASKPGGLKNSSKSPIITDNLPKTRTDRCKSKQPDERDPQHIDRVRSNQESILYKDEEKPNDRIDKIIQRNRDERDKEKKNTNDKVGKIDQHIRKHEDRRQKNKENKRQERSHRQQEDQCTSEPDNKKEDDGKPNIRVGSFRKVRDSTPQSKEESSKENSESKDTIGGGRTRQEAPSKQERDSNHEPSSSMHISKRRLSRENHTEQSARKRRRRSRGEAGEAVEAAAGGRSTSPHRLLADVVFVLSGYQNPRRAAIRDRALAMGARYRQDWGPGCTHLISAFPNTPKLRAVRASDDDAVIVRGEWVEECCRERRRVPWSWHATEPARRRPRPPAATTAARSDHSEECDTDDEIQRVLDKQKTARTEPKSKEPSSERTARGEPSEPEPKPDQGGANTSRESDVSFVRDERIKGNVSISDSETDSYTDEETCPVNGKDVEIEKDKCLPDFFEGYTFAIDPTIRDSGFDTSFLKRYITAYSGQVVEHIHRDSNIDYVLSLSGACGVTRAAAAGAVVRPDWLWRCNDNRKKVSTKDFLLK